MPRPKTTAAGNQKAGGSSATRRGWQDGLDQERQDDHEQQTLEEALQRPLRQPLEEARAEEDGGYRTGNQRQQHRQQGRQWRNREGPRADQVRGHDGDQAQRQVQGHRLPRPIAEWPGQHRQAKLRATPADQPAQEGDGDGEPEGEGGLVGS